jgi:hypothetical protein
VSFLEAIDKYKFGLLAALAVYVGIFIYLNMDFYTTYFAIEPFYKDGSHVEIPEDDIHLRPENILVPAQFSGDVKNLSVDANDKRKASDENYSALKSVAEVEAEYKALEQKMYDEAGGAKTREQIRKEMADRKLANAANTPDKNPNVAHNDGLNKVGSDVLAKFSLGVRTPHQNNDWYIRKPGYKCENGAQGKVMVLIQVSSSGTVTNATYDPSQSIGANACMIKYAVEYAKKSRFNYSGSASKTESGWILYTYVP